MKLYLRGHDNKYAVEQMLLTLYPGERPEYPRAHLRATERRSAAAAAGGTPLSPAACGGTAYVTPAEPL